MIAICDPPPPASDWSIRRQNPVTGDPPQASTPYKRTDDDADNDDDDDCTDIADAPYLYGSLYPD